MFLHTCFKIDHNWKKMLSKSRAESGLVEMLLVVLSVLTRAMMNEENLQHQGPLSSSDLTSP